MEEGSERVVVFLHLCGVGAEGIAGEIVTELFAGAADFAEAQGMVGVVTEAKNGEVE